MTLIVSMLSSTSMLPTSHFHISSFTFLLSSTSLWCDGHLRHCYHWRCDWCCTLRRRLRHR
ncbi:unnamed protein product [Brassica napus]|uniref:(rape) hypothetical protein n=1 Tax=Brassica napus TaxID=3708 RepID=A0A816TB11_BRANA|nr:unnamed protein product [Brassica napus]